MIAAALLAAASVWAAAPCRPAGERLRLPNVRLENVVQDIGDPVAVAFPGDASGRMFVAEQRGRILVVQGGKLSPQPFLDIHKHVRSGGEMGLLGLAFHPRFAENGRFFVNYTTRTAPLQSVISEFRVDPKNGTIVDASRERPLLKFTQPYTNHNGGQLAFGPDGLLYIGVGDGGSANDPHNNGQRLDTLLGKILRIDVDRNDPGLEYAIPKDNPLVGRADARPEIYAWGLRNPWRFSFDALTGTLYAGDVGQSRREEIDIVAKGGNYGWRVMEGLLCTPGVSKKCDPSGFIPPIHEYGRSDGISVTGGFVYRGSSFPELCGAYLFGDYGSGRIWGLRYDPSSRKVFAHRLVHESGVSISSFGQGEDLELYIADHGGRVLKIVP